MSVFIASLNSGSNGNCYYIGTRTEAVLIDAGISCRETERRLRRLDLKTDHIKAIFISHEHIDHIKGVEILAGRYNIPVYITQATLSNSRTRPPAHLINHFSAYQPLTIGGFTVTAFPKLHDAADPHSFLVAANGITTGIFTDIGAPCDHVRKHFSQCHAAFLEANYDDHMLETGRYPYHLKKRISGDKGHLSNAQALELFNNHRPPFMKHLLLSHLSKDNNSPETAIASFAGAPDDIHISVASRFEATAVYDISDTTSDASTKLTQGVLF